MKLLKEAARRARVSNLLLAGGSRRTVTFLKAEKRILPQYTEENQRDWNGSFEFVFITDPQLGFINQTYEGGRGLTWLEELENVRNAVKLINNMDPLPQFVCIGGDMVNAYPSRGEELRTKQANDLKRVFIQLNSDIPIVFVSGNHDLGKHPDREAMSWYHRHFGDDFYSFWHSGVLFIVLNTQFIKFPHRIPLDEVEEQQQWLENLLKKVHKYDPPPKHIVFFMHIPLFWNRADEVDHPCNMPQYIRHSLLRQFAKSNVTTVFCGHTHINFEASWICEAMNREIQLVVSAAIGCPLGPDPAGIRRVRVHESGIEHQYIKVGDKNADDYKRLNKQILDDKK